MLHKGTRQALTIPGSAPLLTARLPQTWDFLKYLNTNHKSHVFGTGWVLLCRLAFEKLLQPEHFEPCPAGMCNPSLCKYLEEKFVTAYEMLRHNLWKVASREER